MRHSDIRLTMNHYTDASQLPVVEAIENLPVFGSADTAAVDTQRNPQTADISSHSLSFRGTEKGTAEASKVVYPKEFWHERTAADTTGHFEEKNCLARIRT